jgi:hypothetical protein
VNREQKASPFPRSNARRQLSALQSGQYCFWIEELTVDVCIVVMIVVTAVTDELLNGEELF